MTAADFGKLRERGFPKGVTVHKVCRLVREEDEVKQILDFVWSDSEDAAGVLEELEKGDEDLYRFEKMLEAR